MAQGTVISSERSTVEGVECIDVKVDVGGSTITADYFQGAGDDALPLPGDYVDLVDGDGAGNREVIGVHDGKNRGTAAAGERRTYARAPSGEVVGEIWAKANGDIAIRSIKTGGKIILNGVEIDQQGNVKAPGEVTAMSAGPGVKLSTHLHGSGTGPTTAPTPGT